MSPIQKCVGARYRPAPELRTNVMPPWLPVFASVDVPPRAIQIHDHGWVILCDGRIEQMPAGVYVYGPAELG